MASWASRLNQRRLVLGVVVLLVVLVAISATDAYKMKSNISATSRTDELIIVGRLKYISSPPACGIISSAAIAEYTDLKILSGKYSKDSIYVVHGCPEMKRSEFVQNSGSLDVFHVGNYHILHLTLKNIYKVGVIDLGNIQLPVAMQEACTTPCDAETLVRHQNGMMYFSSQVDLFSQ